MTRHSWIATIILLTALAPTAGTPAEAGEAELDRALAIFDALDAVTIGLSCEEAPIEDVIGRVAQAANLPIRADWPALDRLGVARFEPITLDLDSVPASTVLAAIALQLGDEYDRPMFEAFGGHVILTSVDATREMSFPDAYDVRDLLAHDPVVDKLRAATPTITVPSRNAGDTEEDDAPDAPIEDDGKGASDDGAGGLPPIEAIEINEADIVPLTPGEELMELVVEHVEPEAWIEYGGTRASVRERRGVLLVTAPASMHRKIRDVLARLRRMNPSELRIDAAIVDLPREVHARLARRHAGNDMVLARALLADAQATVRWRATSVVALGHELEQTSEDAGVTMRLVLVPRRGEADGSIELSVDASCSAGEDQRSARTVITVPTRTGGAAIELPSAAATDELRMLVIVPIRA